MGIADDERLENRDTKYPRIVHAEVNAVLFAQRDLSGCTLYTWPFQSCDRCAAMVCQTGIVAHVYPFCDNPRWREAFEIARDLYLERGIELREYVWEESDAFMASNVV